jgi:hypothetical protein
MESIGTGEKRNSFIKRERLNSAFKKYDGNTSTVADKQEAPKEPTFGVTSKNQMT